jgi:hypothetical protein
MAKTGARLHWNGLILAALIGGPVLAIAAAVAQIVLAPPWLAYTGLFYFLLGVVGLPILIFGLMSKHVRGWWWLGASLLLGVLLTLLLAVLGPGVLELENCRADRSPASNGVQRYVCESRTYQQTVIEYVIEGPQGWPFARLVGVRD